MIKKIAIASILKPVDDVRGYWKIAQSLAKTNKYEVNIIGNVGKKESDHPKIIFHSNRIHRNQWVKRVILSYKILVILFKLKPSIIIITTHELLLISLIIKLLINSKIIYDVQENYRCNIKLQKSLPRKIYSHFVGLKEDLLSRWIDHFWFAEKHYLEELNYGKNNHSILQNKAIKINKPVDIRFADMRIIFSGTVSNYSGASIAMDIMQSIISEKPKSHGMFIGQIHDSKLKLLLFNKAYKNRNIQMILSKHPIPYDQILEKIQWANLAIIAYTPDEVNYRKMPTKLYEYSRYGLPFLVQEKTLWSKTGKIMGGAIPIDLLNPNMKKIVETLENPERLFSASYHYNDTWEHESQKLINSINDLLINI
ncbi:MAG: hypothetical protein AAGC64_09170 [Bacteroidota bacterium]